MRLSDSAFLIVVVFCVMFGVVGQWATDIGASALIGEASGTPMAAYGLFGVRTPRKSVV